MIHRIEKTILLTFLWLSPWTPAKYIDNPIIESPKSGEVVQGIITITGSTDIIGFQSYELFFAYAIDDTDTWFLLSQSKQTVNGGILGTWDTTTITDGNYRLMLRVYFDDFTTRETIVTGLKVRNYTPIETEISPSSTTISGPEVTQVSQPAPIKQSPQELPSNPANITSKGLLKSIGIGIIISLIALFIIGGLVLFRTLSRRK